MKNIIIIVLIFALAAILHKVNNTPKVDLPEEYQLITKDTPIQGHFEGKTLVIEFKHNYK